jgi:DNA-directed RNA polymerase subunit F
MDIINSHSAMLSNYEVYDFITKLPVSSKTDGSQGLATITYETKNYLSSTPCSKQASEKIDALLRNLQKYKLTKAEKLQLINHMPSQPVELQLLIEEIDERFSDDEVMELIDLITQHES